MPRGLENVKHLIKGLFLRPNISNITRKPTNTKITNKHPKASTWKTLRKKKRKKKLLGNHGHPFPGAVSQVRIGHLKHSQNGEAKASLRNRKNRLGTGQGNSLGIHALCVEPFFFFKRSSARCNLFLFKQAVFLGVTYVALGYGSKHVKTLVAYSLVNLQF